jgi:hypothetical protein
MDEYKPKTVLGKRLWALRQEYIKNGGELLTAEEIRRLLERDK